MCASMKPWMAALTLTAFEMTSAGYLPSAGIDAYFSDRADEAGKDSLSPFMMPNAGQWFSCPSRSLKRANAD